MLWPQHKNNPFLHLLRMTRDTVIVLKNFLSIRLKTLKTNINLCIIHHEQRVFQPKCRVMKYAFIVHGGVRLEMNFVCLSHDSHFLMQIATSQLQYFQSSSGNEVNCLQVTICSTLVRCHWCISIFIIILVVRWCSLMGPYMESFCFT